MCQATIWEFFTRNRILIRSKWCQCFLRVGLILGKNNQDAPELISVTRFDGEFIIYTSVKVEYVWSCRCDDQLDIVDENIKATDLDLTRSGISSRNQM